MKNKLFITFVLVTLFATSCSGQRSDVIEIWDIMFIGQVNEIYLNAEDYMGKTIKLEGVFLTEHWEGGDYSFVVRYGPDCCGDDGRVGFQVELAENLHRPESDSWVEAVGELKSEPAGNGLTYLYLDLSSITVRETRGAEFVFR